MRKNSIEINASNVHKILARARKKLASLPRHDDLPTIEMLRLYNWPEEAIKMALGDAYTPITNEDNLK